MPSNVRLEFPQGEIFKKVSENLKKSDDKTKCLIDCKDDVLFVWDNKDKRLLTQIVKGFNTGISVYQELNPTNPPLIDIHFLRVNDSVTKAALWSTAGVMVMAIPKRWGSQSGFQGGKPVILSTSRIVDPIYFAMRNIEVRQVRFHPGAPQDNYLVVLTSDNTFRVYALSKNDSAEEELNGPNLVHVWPLSQNTIDGKEWNLKRSKGSCLGSLGDMAVDFDFGPSTLDEEGDSCEEVKPEAVIWPAVILRGNGDVCILNTSLICDKKVKFEGPLTIYPPADDNYGVEACSILALSTTPTAVIVATSSGTLYHSILLKSEENQKEVISKTHRLYVLETVELELGIQLKDDDPSYTCPIILHKDPVCRWKYYCTHNTGLHAVSAFFVWQLEKYVETDSAVSPQFDQPSKVEYLISTRTNATPILPVVGFTIITSSNNILTLLGNGDLISLALKVTDVFTNRELTSSEGVSEEATPIRQLLQEPFDAHIRNLLGKNINQPLIKLPKNVNLSPQESLDLISRTTEILRQEYFSKFRLVKDEIDQRAMTLRALKALHLDELEQLHRERSSLQGKAEKLAEKYEEIKDKQLSLNQRIERVLCTILQLEPIESLAEKKMKNELTAVHEKLENFEKSISRLIKEMDYQKYKKAEYRREMMRTFELGENQVDTIKTSLNQTAREIGDLVNVIKSLKRQLYIGDA